jgi:hypothetical protein
LKKGILPIRRTNGRKPWFKDPGLDCISKNNQATEIILSYWEGGWLNERGKRCRIVLFDTSVFDVRRDFIRLMNDMKTGSLNSKLSRRRVSAIKMIVKEVRQRIEEASRTLPQALGDLEMMRLKFYG